MKEDLISGKIGAAANRMHAQQHIGHI